MEIKRFVLLNDYNLILDSKNEEELRVIHYKDGDVLKVVADNWYYPLEKLDYKTSDRILDLVVDGDLIEIKDSVYVHRVYEQTYKGLDNQVLPFIYMTIHTTSQYLLSEVNKEVITAIYKRQTNGDYKRYEVGGKE